MKERRLLLAACLLLPVFATADDDMKSLTSQAVSGPSNVTLKNQAVLRLPAGFSYLAAGPAAKLMAQMGNHTDDDFLGIVFQHGAEWFVDLEYRDAGYVKDDDAKHWDADALLQSLKDGTEAGNEERRSHKVPELEVTGWAEPPAYNAATHRLVWSALAREKNAPQGQAQTVNYNTYALGREGYVSLNLVTDAEHINADKHVATELLGDLDFNDGKRYADFNSSTDHVAAYGLAALVAGVAAKKLGLLAMAGLFLAKFFKIIAVAAVAGGAALRNRFKRNA